MYNKTWLPVTHQTFHLWQPIFVRLAYVICFGAKKWTVLWKLSIDWCILALIVFAQYSRLSVNSVFFSEATSWIKVKLYGKLPIHHYLQKSFFFSKNSTFYEFFTFVSMGPIGWSDAILPTNHSRFFILLLNLCLQYSHIHVVTFSDFLNVEIYNFNIPWHFC